MYEKYKLRTKKKLLEQVKKLGVLDADAIEIVEEIESRKNKKYENYKMETKLFINKISKKLAVTK